MQNTLFPIFLKTNDLRFLIIGGGNVGFEKAQTLLKQNKDIDLTIVSKHFKDNVLYLPPQYPNIKVIHRPFSSEDLDDKDIIIIATDNSKLNSWIKEEANKKNILVNAADQPELCDFYLGAIVKKGNLKIAISTNGKSPVLARRFREYFEQSIPDNVNETIENLNFFRNEHKGCLQDKLKDLNNLTTVMVSKNRTKSNTKTYVRNISLLFCVFFIGYGFSTLLPVNSLGEFLYLIPNEFYYMLIVGFFAQMVDGALGLGYGMTSASAMMAMGIKLPAISGSIHTAEMFSSAISGYSHYKFGNVNKKMLIWLAVPGVIGAILGSLFVIYIGEKYEYMAYPFVAFYLLLIAIRLISLAFRKKVIKKPVKRLSVLGFSGGFFDAFGGGGWGPIVTSTLLTKGRQSKYVIGTVSLAEFFVTFAATMTFFTNLGVDYWYIVLGLIIGGIIAAPLAAKLVGKIPQKLSFILVGILVIVASVRIIIKMI
ncbi:MAG TPA: TSUP family transporter [Dysgonamonadaceae bacterium]|nr:TSUP family transporter [Dysgonamonadaceae bacterium]